MINFFLHSYKRSASLSQFVMHRGLIISVMQVGVVRVWSDQSCNLPACVQAVFSAVFYFAAVALYEGVLMVG